MKLRNLYAMMALMTVMFSSNSFAKCEKTCELTPGQVAIQSTTTIDR